MRSFSRLFLKKTDSPVGGSSCRSPASLAAIRLFKLAFPSESTNKQVSRPTSHGRPFPQCPRSPDPCLLLPRPPNGTWLCLKRRLRSEEKYSRVKIILSLIPERQSPLFFELRTVFFMRCSGFLFFLCRGTRTISPILEAIPFPITPVPPHPESPPGEISLRICFLFSLDFALGVGFTSRFFSGADHPIGLFRDQPLSDWWSPHLPFLPP